MTLVRAPSLSASIGVALVAVAITGAAPAAAQPATAPPTATPAPAASTTAPRAAGRGAVVVALGDGAAEAARALAREVYADPALRPPVDEATAQVLAGAPAPDGASSITRDRAALRASLAPDLTSPATRRALESLAAELGAAAAIAVVRATDGEPRARVVLAGAADAAPIELVGRIDAGGAPTWPSALLALRGVVAPASTAASPAPAGTSAPASSSGGAPPAGAPPAGAPAAGAPHPAASAPRSGAAAPAPPPAEDPREFYERPWFWVALGAFAAAGLTALVVSQTSDGDEASDSVRFRATIPEAQLTFP